MCNEGSHHLVDSPEPMEQLTFIFCLTTVRWKDVSDSRTVVRGGAGGTLAPPDFVVLEKRAEREIDNQLPSAPPDLKT